MADRPTVEVGDTIRLYIKIIESGKERTQPFEGVVIRARKGGNNANFTVRRIASHGVGVERTFLTNSPRIDRIEIKRHFPGLARRVHCVDIPDAASMPAATLAEAARGAGLDAAAAADFDSALAAVAADSPGAPPRVLICGSLYLAGWLLRRIGPPR